jgi:thiol-disulfide isomerase/thioredoxin
MKAIASYDELIQRMRQEKAVLFYFSTPACGVCKSIKPKVISLVQEHFPLLKLYYIDTEAVPEARGQFSLYSVPVVLVFFQGREYIREARNFGIMELGAKIDRYYSMLFEAVFR